MVGAMAFLRTLLGQARSGAWLTRERVRAYATIMIVIELAGFAFCVAGTHGLVVPLHRPVSTDFVSFYAAGWLADAGTPALVYDQAAHYAAEQAAREPGIPARRCSTSCATISNSTARASAAASLNAARAP